MRRGLSRARRIAAAASVALVFAADLALAEGSEIEDLLPLVRSDGIFLSFRLLGGFDEETEQAIATGLEVSFRYNVELKRSRGIWFDSLVARREIRTTVVYDNLTKRYKLTREIDGKVDASEVVADAEAMRRFMATFESLRLFDLAEVAANESYYVRVKAVLRDRNLLLLVPWDVGTAWKEVRFDYVP